MTNKLMTLALVVILLFTTSMGAFAADSITVTGNNNIVFKDINNYPWAKEAINNFIQSGAIQGDGNGNFMPNDILTREQLAKIITLGFMLDTTSYLGFEKTYADVDINSWSYPYVEASQKYLTGYSVPTSTRPVFRGAVNASREEIAVAVAKILAFSEKDLNNKSILSNYKDGDEVAYQLRPLVGAVVEKAIMKGFEDQTLRLDKPLTRAEAVTLLYRASKNYSMDFKNLNYPSSVITNSFTLSGEIEPNTRVFINNKEVEVDDSGKFTTQLEVESDAEQLNVKLRAEKGSKVISKTITIPVAMSAPKISIINYTEQPTEPTAEIQGRVTDKSKSNLRLYVQNQEISLDTEGYFTTQVDNLKEGVNAIKLKVVNAAGVITEQTVEIIYEIKKPLARVTEPADSSPPEVITQSEPRQITSPEPGLDTGTNYGTIDNPF